MEIVENRENEGRTIWGVLGHEAHVELVEGGYLVVTRRSTSVRRAFSMFTTYDDAVEHLAAWTATETKGE